jgi:thymidine kinase
MSSGELNLLLGPMFSDKSSELKYRYERGHVKCFSCVVSFRGDDRSEDSMLCHDGSTLSGVWKLNRLSELPASVVKEKLIFFIDEVQFFPDAREFIVEALANGKTVHAAGLDSTFDLKCFPVIAELIPLATTYTKKTGVCRMCLSKKNASGTPKVVPSTHTFRTADDREMVSFGGDEKYIPVCLPCHFALTKAKNEGTPVKIPSYQTLLSESGSE